ncbi:Sec7-domain-containing protein [Crepidotus variabilis]|uniref:Sec7-domain-containing protein n=1 Tax=Crepidotus variabilis TaxID=179855 RepID=A0A9P6JUB7_9AGAR|nr:Sec7-domain-containing protein [Crepidotus variabilis]
MDSSTSPTPALLKHVLLSEILSVTSIMRKNSRWASSSLVVTVRDAPALGSNMGLRIASPAHQTRPPGRTSKETELMANFLELKRGIKTLPDVRQVDLPELLAPFFAILRSPLSTGPITSAALSSLHSFFVCGLISPESHSLEAALIELSSTISHCKFEASDSSGDEVVLLRIMTVIQDCLCGTAGSGLGDIEVCEMLETVLTTCCQMRLSETLRRAAETTMHSLVRTVFAKLHQLDPEEEEAKLALEVDDEKEAEIRLTVATEEIQPPLALTVTEESPIPSSESTLHEEASLRQEGVTEVPSPSTEATTEKIEDAPAENSPHAPVAPVNRPEYGLPSIVELLRVLVNVLDPNDQQHTDSTRLTALGILNAAFEVAGARLAEFKSLKAIIVDSGCKFLFQLARSENTNVLQWALRTTSTIFDTMSGHLKLQQELFLTFTIDRLTPPPSAPGKAAVIVNSRSRGYSPSPRVGTPAATNSPLLLPTDKSEADSSTAPSRLLVAPAKGETRDLILETLSQVAGHASFMVDLYTNYDCDPNCENLFERLVDFLTKAVYPYAGMGSYESQRNVQYICLELLLSFVNDMTTRALEPVQSAAVWPNTFPDAHTLLQSKSKKQLILTGANRFNAKPKAGLAFLEEKGLIYNQSDPHVTKAWSLASFLKSCTRIDKRLLGDFISKPDNIDLLTAFIGLFDFKEKPIAEAMREMLEAFRLPGESQQIARITETFATIYFATKPAEIKSEDAIYVLSYSIIMLNTDQHNPQIRKRMTIEDYTRNLRGVNDGSDFSPEFLQTIYDSIRKREIVMPEEHIGQLGFEYAWKELLARSRQSGKYLICNTSQFDIEMFKTVWRPVITAIAFAFISFEDDYIIQRAIAGFRQCATLAQHFNLPDVFDFVVISLSQATSLLSDSLPAQVPNYPVINIEGQSVTVSKLSVEFGTNFRGQLAAVVLFNIVNGNGNALREGWTQIFEMFQNLFLHSLLPTRMLQMEDFLGGVTMIPLRGSQPSKSQVRNDGGLLSALSSYLMTPYNSEMVVPDATEADVEKTLSTIDCITSCRLDELYSQIIQLDVDALVAAIRALEALAHDRSVAKLNGHADDVPPIDEEPYQLSYDPASIFLLEIMVSITNQTPQYIEELWPPVFEHLSALLSASNQYSILLIERAVVCLLRLCQILALKPNLRDQVYLAFDLLACLPPKTSNLVGEQIIAGLILVIQKQKDIIKSQTEWNVVFALIRSTMLHPEAARLSFELIEALSAEGPDNAVVPDNFSGLLAVLDDFAIAAGNVQEQQQPRGRRSEPLLASNSPIIARGKVAVDLLALLHRKLASWVQSSEVLESQAWRYMALPLFINLGRHSVNASREIRHTAISHLQRILLGSPLANDAEQSKVEEIFNRVIFPLVDELLRPQTTVKDPQGMVETRMRGSALLCKVFMHLELRESRAKTDFRLLWIQVLDLLDRLMSIGRGDQLREAVPESLKNVLLVMSAVGILVPPGTERTDLQKTLWSNTHERMERFLPGFLAEVIPPPIEGVTTESV